MQPAHPQDGVAADAAAAADAQPDDAATGPDLPTEGWVPKSTTDLYGAWESAEDGILRRYEFRFLDNMYFDMTATTPAYRLLKGPVDGTLTLLERGGYGLSMGPILVTKSVWALDASTTGQSREAEFVPSPEDNSFSLQVVPGVRRIFYRVASFTFP